MDINILEKKLNNEYKDIGKIKIYNIEEDTVEAGSIRSIESVIRKIKPLNSSEPIIVRRVGGVLSLIDGYHRLKYHKENNLKIKVIILGEYKIDRKTNTYLEFIESLVGKTICFLDDYSIEVEGKIYTIEPNEGCGGCSNGWSSIDVSKEVLNKKIKIKDVLFKNDVYNEDSYSLFINGEYIANVDTGWGNGYYGGDFEINI